jgi:aminopeptidase N
MRIPEYVTVHAIGHNWFQGILASNEPEEAWMDEGINEWADAKVMGELYGPRASMMDWMGWQAEVAALMRAVSTDPSSMPSPIATAAYAFVDGPNHGAATTRARGCDSCSSRSSRSAA